MKQHRPRTWLDDPPNIAGCDQSIAKAHKESPMYHRLCSLALTSALSLALAAVMGLYAPPTANAAARLVAKADAKADAKAKAKTTTDAKGNQVVTIKQPDRIKYKKVTKHIFDGTNIGGKIYGPGVPTITAKYKVTFASMLTLRPHFHKEMWKAAKNM